MAYDFSQVSSKMKSSKIRELMKYASMPGVISFAGGMPDPDNFPFDDVKSIINNWDQKSSKIAMQYGTTNGYGALIEDIIKRMTTIKHINPQGQGVVVTTGGQQGLYLVAKIFLDPGDVILVEDPTFIGGMASFLSCQAEVVGVSLEDDGVNVDELETTFLSLKKAGKNVKFFYTIPNFQNPKGSTMSFAKRKKLYEMSKKHNLVIIEDDPYGDLFYTGTAEDYLPVKSLGNDAPIIYIGSFSKVLSPGFRLGWIYADDIIIDKAALAKQSIDACSSSFGQVIASDYLKLGKIDDYLTKMRSVYSKKKNLMMEMITRYFPESVKVTNAKGGFFIYAKLPDGISGNALFLRTIKENVAFVTGEPFHTDPVTGDQHIRLSFSNSSDDEIKKGIKIIGDTITAMIKDM